jgi:hypothetical protein
MIPTSLTQNALFAFITCIVLRSVQITEYEATHYLFNSSIDLLLLLLS